jgi:DNA-binding NarL/FixJ family response regulator
MIKNVLILEDYATSRELLAGALEKAFGDIGIFEAVTLTEARTLIRSHYYDLAIVDLNLPDGRGVELIKELREISPDTICVVATVFDDDQNLFESLQSGAHGYLLKEDSRKDLIKHLEGILEGRPPLSPSMASKMIAYFNKISTAEQSLVLTLTEREREVLQLIAQGKPRKKIATLLDISLHTTNDHIKAVYRKLKVSSSVEAARVAIASGIST